MNNQFKNIDLELKDLKPEVREKALEILKEMNKEIGVDEKSSIKKAIAEAENWFLDSEG